MKKILSIAVLLFVAVAANAQFAALIGKATNKNSELMQALHAEQPAGAFEGQIDYETFENYSKSITKYAMSIYFNGVHKMHLYIKGGKMHLYDETTQCHTVYDGENYYHYCDFTKTGMNFKTNFEVQLMAAPYTLNMMGTDEKVTVNTFAKTDETKELNGKMCTLYKGTIGHDAGGTNMKVECHAYCTDIPASTSYNLHVWGMPMPFVAEKWIMKCSQHIMMAGEISLYIEADVTNMEQKSIADDMFTVPSDYKFSSFKNSFSAFAMMKYYTGVSNALKKAGIKGGDSSAKTTGVHYKTEDEWDF